MNSRASTTTEEKADPYPRQLLFTLAQYDGMIATGIVPEGEPYELLDGRIVRKDRSASGEDPMTVGDDHIAVVLQLNDLNDRLKPLGCHLRPQQPIAIPPSHAPEPDGTIVRGQVKDVPGRASPEDILCVIEVADASLRRDRTTKLAIYAGAGISPYLIINLQSRVIELYTDPHPAEQTYQKMAKLTDRHSITLPTAKGSGLSIPVRDLLPRPRNRGNGRRK